MTYKPTLPPNIVDATALLTWFTSELNRLAEYMESPELVEIGKEPSKPLHGKLYFADGTGWDPGSGQGLYQYRTGSGYVFLG